MSLDDIKNFVAVSENLNITRASEFLGVSQPTLSYSMKRLESEFNEKLIIRLKNGIQLTKLGEEFYGRAKRLILYWEDSRKIFSVEDRHSFAEFSIGIHPSVAIYSLDKFLPEVYRKYPRLSFNLLHGLSREMSKKVINWEVDFAIAINPIEHLDIVIKEIGKDEVTLFSTSRSLKKIIYDPRLAQSVFIMKKIKKLNLHTREYIHSSNLEVIAKLCSSGLGYGLLPTRVANNYKNLKKLAGAPKFIDRICLIYRKERHGNSISQNILKIIKESIL